MTPPIHLYTDGSCHTQLKTGAWAAIVLINQDKTILHSIVTNTTHNRMELTAVIKAIEYIQAQSIQNQPIHIYSDSQYVVNLASRKEKLIQCDFTTKRGTLMQNADLVRILIQHIERENLLFIKVKAHQKQPQTSNYNREVDILVRKILRSCLNKL